MGKLYIVRGLPGAGKTKNAKEWVSHDPESRARMNRDDYRAMIHGGYVDRETEEMIVSIQHQTIAMLLAQDKEVICDDTNLPMTTVKSLITLAKLMGAEWEIVDKTNIAPEICVIGNDSQHRRDTGAVVPEKVIWDMYEKYIKGRGYPLPLEGIE